MPLLVVAVKGSILLVMFEVNGLGVRCGSGITERHCGHLPSPSGTLKDLPIDGGCHFLVILIVLVNPAKGESKR